MEALIFKMVTMCVSRESLALLLTEEELGDVRAAVRRSLECAGLEPWHDLEAELFERGRRPAARAPAPAAAHPPALSAPLRQSAMIFTNFSFLPACSVV